MCTQRAMPKNWWGYTPYPGLPLYNVINRRSAVQTTRVEDDGFIDVEEITDKELVSSVMQNEAKRLNTGTIAAKNVLEAIKLKRNEAKKAKINGI